MDKRAILLAAALLTLPLGIWAADEAAAGTGASDGASTAIVVRREGDPEPMAVPAAQAYADRLAVTVDTAEVHDGNMELSYPDVKSVSPYVQKKINKTLTDYVKSIEKKAAKESSDDKQSGALNTTMKYEVKANGNGIFSIVFETYFMREMAANGYTEAKGFTFNTTTGRKLSLSDFGGINKDAADKAVIAEGKRNDNLLYSDFSGIQKMTGDFYALENHDIYLIFQQGDVGPMSSGTVYVPVGNLGR